MFSLFVAVIAAAVYFVSALVLACGGGVAVVVLPGRYLSVL